MDEKKFNLTQTGQQVQDILNSAKSTDQVLTEIQEAMENLPDGQAVSAQVALNTVAIQNLDENKASKTEVENDYAKKTECVFDISAYHATGTPPVLATYADLANALGTDGANIPDALRKGGMSVKFVHTSDNKYMQARCMAQNFTADITQWQVVDTSMIAGSKNLVDSNSVAYELNRINGDITVSANIKTGTSANAVIYPYQLKSGDKVRIKITASSSSVIPSAGKIILRGSDNTALVTNKYWSVGDDYTFVLDRNIDYIVCIIASGNIGANGTLSFETFTKGFIQELSAAILNEKNRAEGIESGLRQDVNAADGKATQANNAIALIDNELLQTNGDRITTMDVTQNTYASKIIYPYSIKSGEKVRIKITSLTSGIITAGGISLRKNNSSDALASGHYWSVGDDYSFTLDEDINYINCVISANKVQASGTLSFEVITEGAIQNIEKDIQTINTQITQTNGKIDDVDAEVIKERSIVGYYSKKATIQQGTTTRHRIDYLCKQDEKLNIKISGSSSLIAIDLPFVIKANDINGNTIGTIGLNNWNSFVLQEDVSIIFVLISGTNSAATGEIVIEVSSNSAILAYKEMNQNTNTDFKNYCKAVGTTPIATWVDDDGRVIGTDKNIQTNVLPIAEEFGIPVTFGILDLDNYATWEPQAITKVAFFKLMQQKGHQVTSHPVHEHWYGAGYDLSKVEPELIDNLTLLHSNTVLHSEMLIYPGSSSSNPAIVEIVRKWCTCGVTAGLNKANHLGDNTKWQIKRTFISFASIYDSHHNDQGFVSARQWLIDVIDEAYENGDWIVFGTHSWNYTDSDDTTDPNADTRGNLRYIINYAVNKGFDFRTLWDAYNRRHYLFDAKETNTL